MNSFHKAKEPNRLIMWKYGNSEVRLCVEKRPELRPDVWILHHDNAPAHKALSVEQFLAQKSITEMEHPLYSPDLVPHDFWPFPKMKSALKGRRFQDTEDIKKKCDDGTESYSTHNRRS
jgi:hypothetical protein